MSCRLHVVEQTDPRRIEARIEIPGRNPFEGFIEANVDLNQSADAWLPLSLLAAMWAGETLEVDGPVDPVLLRNVDQVSTLMEDWWPDLLTQVQVTVPAADLQKRASGVGAFFSGGVDSFYTAAKELDEITHFIIILGFDVHLDDEQLVESTLQSIRRAASDLNKPLVEVRTNIGELTDGILDWQYHSHGAGLAGVGHALCPVIGRVLIPGSYSDGDMHRQATHPQLDPLWSSSSVEFVHHGTEANRVQKVKFIANNQPAMDHLRVCWWNPNSEYNCGQCEKCVRTMVSLRAVGASAKCSTLPALRPGQVARQLLIGSARDMAKENREALSETSGNKELKAELAFAIARSAAHERGSRLKSAIKRLLSDRRG